MKRLIVSVLALASAVYAADTVYKSIGPDGRVIYSQTVPVNQPVEKTLRFENLPASPLPESVVRYREELEKGMKDHVAAATQTPRRIPALFIAQWCGYCKQAKRYLTDKKIAYTEYDIDTQAGVRALTATNPGKGGIPVLIAEGKRLTGFSVAAYDAFFKQTPR